MRYKIILTAIAAAMLFALPAAEVQAQFGIGIGGGGYGGGGYGGYRGGGVSAGLGGFSIGNGRTGVTIGSGGYGNYGYGPYNNGYGRGWNNGYNNGWGNGYYGNNYDYGNQGYGNRGYSNGYYTQPATQPATQYYSQPTAQYYSQSQSPVAAPYEGPGVTIHNPSDQTLSFTINDSRQLQVTAGETVHLDDQGQFQIAFDRGGENGQARYTIREGTYDFAGTDKGWELYRQKADAAANVAHDNRTNPARTQVLRPQIDGDQSGTIQPLQPNLNDPQPNNREASADAPRLDATPRNDQPEFDLNNRASDDLDAVPPPPSDDNPLESNSTEKSQDKSDK